MRWSLEVCYQLVATPLMSSRRSRKATNHQHGAQVHVCYFECLNSLRAASCWWLVPNGLCPVTAGVDHQFKEISILEGGKWVLVDNFNVAVPKYLVLVPLEVNSLGSPMDICTLYSKNQWEQGQWVKWEARDEGKRFGVGSSWVMCIFPGRLWPSKLNRRVHW